MQHKGKTGVLSGAALVHAAAIAASSGSELQCVSLLTVQCYLQSRLHETCLHLLVLLLLLVYCKLTAQYWALL